MRPITNTMTSSEKLISSKTAKFDHERRFGCFRFLHFRALKACFNLKSQSPFFSRSRRFTRVFISSFFYSGHVLSWAVDSASLGKSHFGPSLKRAFPQTLDKSNFRYSFQVRLDHTDHNPDDCIGSVSFKRASY